MVAHHELSIGNHQFNGRFEDDFFGKFPEGEVTGGSGTVVLNIEKRASLITIGIVIDGEVKVPCDRCLEDIVVPVSFRGDLLVKMSYEVKEPTFDDSVKSMGETLWISPVDEYIELEQYIYESIVLVIPYSRIHTDDEDGISMCNPEMLERFGIAEDDDFDLEDNDNDDEYNF